MDLKDSTQPSSMTLEQSKEVKALQKQLAEAKKEAINTYADVASADLEKQIRTVQTQIDNGDYAKPKNKKMLHESKQSAMDDAEFEKALKDEYAKGYSTGKQATYRERARGYAH